MGIAMCHFLQWFSSHICNFWIRSESIPQGAVDNNLGPDRLAGHKAPDPNPLIARPLSGSPNCAW